MSHPPFGPPAGPPPAGPPRPSGQGVDGRILAGALLLAAAASAFVVALVLVHGNPTVTVSGTRTDADGASRGLVITEVRCVAASGGSKGYVRYDDQADATEGSYVSTEDGDQGLGEGQVNALCDRARDARITHGTELGFVGLLLGWGGVTLVRRRRA